MDSVIVSAPAKINWTLDILSVDERGYHLLDMLMQRITLYDTVKVKRAEKGIHLKTSQPWLPCDERNTAYKSASLFFDKTGIDGGAEIFVKKNIPSSAGLAGGSADAAAVFKGLNTVYGNPLTEDELIALALSVGADVPFMLKSGLYRAKGIGEELERLEIKHNVPLVIAMNTRQGASTKRVYSIYDTVGTKKHPDTDGFIDALNNLDYEKMRLYGGNVLTESAVSIAPDIQKNIDALNASGSLYTTMTGSGSAVIGVFKDINDANAASKRLSGCWRFACRASSCGIRIKEN